MYNEGKQFSRRAGAIIVVLQASNGDKNLESEQKFQERSLTGIKGVVKMVQRVCTVSCVLSLLRSNTDHHPVILSHECVAHSPVVDGTVILVSLPLTLRGD